MKPCIDLKKVIIHFHFFTFSLKQKTYTKIINGLIIYNINHYNQYFNDICPSMKFNVPTRYNIGSGIDKKKTIYNYIGNGIFFKFSLH